MPTWVDLDAPIPIGDLAEHLGHDLRGVEVAVVVDDEDEEILLIGDMNLRLGFCECCIVHYRSKVVRYRRWAPAEGPA